MSKYLSNRQKNLKIGISSYTDNNTVLEVTGKVGIGTTDAENYSLYIVGDTNIDGNAYVSKNLGIGTTNPSQTGSSSKVHIFGGNLKLDSNRELVWDGTFPTYIRGSSGTSGKIILNAGNDTSLNYSVNRINPNFSDLSPDNDSKIDLGSSGNRFRYIWSSGPMFIGTASSTGTANQKLQVTGGAYVSGNTGIGTTNPKTKLEINGTLGFTNKTISIGDTTTAPPSIYNLKNIFIGVGAGASNALRINGEENVYIGLYAGSQDRQGQYNVLIGNYAGYQANNFAEEVRIGSYAGANSSGVYNNILIGRYSGGNNSGNNNIIIGENAGYNNSNYDNTIVGGYAGYDNSGYGNNFFGNGAGYSNTDGGNNNYIGYYAGWTNTTGRGNIFFGSNSGISTSASYKVVIGSGNGYNQDFDSPDTTKDTQFAVGVRTDANPSKYWLVGNENFNIGIGTTNPTSKLWVDGDGYFTGVVTSSNFYVGNTLVGSGGSFAQLYVSGITTLAATSGIVTTGGNLYVGNDLFVKDDIESANLNVTGIATIQNLDVQSGFDVYDTQATFHNDVYIAGNLSIGGTTTVISAQDLKVFDKEITLGITTDAFGNDVSNDITANHGGISIASTVGSPLVNLALAGFSTLPATYKQLMWVAANSYGVGTTDAWLFNYAVGIGSTLVPNGVRFAVKGIQFTDDTISAPNLNLSNNLSVSGVSTLGTVKISSGIVTATSGIITYYGDQVIGTPTGGFQSGAVAITTSSFTKDAIDDLNFVLGKLIPKPPTTINGVTLSLTGLTGTALLCTGFTPTNNDVGTITPSAGTSYNRNTTNSVSSSYLTQYGPGDSGTVVAYISNVGVGTTTMSTLNNDGTYGNLQIANNIDAFFSTRNTGIASGFYEIYDARIITANCLDGFNSAYIQHIDGGNIYTTTKPIWYEDPSTVSSPVLSAGSTATPSSGSHVVSYSSGIPHYTNSASNPFTYVLTCENATGDMYSTNTFCTTGGQTNGFQTPGNKSYTDFTGGTNPPTRNYGVGTGVTTLVTQIPRDVHLQVTSSTDKFSTYTASTPYGSSGAFRASLTETINIMGTTATTAKIDEDNILISSLGTGSGNAVRVNAGLGTDNPTPVYTAWNASASVGSSEATIVGGVLKYDVTDYSTGYLPVGPNYSTGRASEQYVQFEIIRSNVSQFKIIVTGTYADCWVTMPNNSTWTTSLSGTNGWADMSIAYRGSGVPTTSEPGCASGSLMTGSSGTFTCTFGTESSSNDTNNRILVRFKLTSGQSITALSFSS